MWLLNKNAIQLNWNLYKLLPFCLYHFVRTILSNTILADKSFLVMDWKLEQNKYTEQWHRIIGGAPMNKSRRRPQIVGCGAALPAHGSSRAYSPPMLEGVWFIGLGGWWSESAESKTCLGDLAFSMAAPRCWNMCRSARTLDSFMSSFMRHCFEKLYLWLTMRIFVRCVTAPINCRISHHRRSHSEARGGNASIASTFPLLFGGGPVE